MININTEQELNENLALLGDLDEGARNKITCALIGHSRIQRSALGLCSCARCYEEQGDMFLGIYRFDDSAVLVGCECPKCVENYKKLSWKDKVFVPYPFDNKCSSTKGKGDEQKDS